VKRRSLRICAHKQTNVRYLRRPNVGLGATVLEPALIRSSGLPEYTWSQQSKQRVGHGFLTETTSCRWWACWQSPRHVKTIMVDDFKQFPEETGTCAASGATWYSVQLLCEQHTSAVLVAQTNHKSPALGCVHVHVQYLPYLPHNFAHTRNNTIVHLLRFSYHQWSKSPPIE
jgi:hypothetical protein